MKAINRDIIREIKKSKMRFFYICAIIALGVAFFCGIKAVSPSMIETALEYFSQYRLSDFRLLSTYGFREEDIQRLADVDGVENAEGAYSMDVIMQIGEDKNVIKIMSLSDGLTVNEPLLIEGELPQRADECVIEEPGRHLGSYKIGDKIRVLDESHTPDELSHLRERNFVITGYIQSPQYISIERGNTTISDGSIDGYVMVLPQSFDYERYTEAYIYSDVSNNDVDPYSDEYSSAQEKMISELEHVGQEILDDNLKDIKSSAYKEISKAENELKANETDFNSQIDAANKEIEDQSARLQEGFRQYDSGVDTFNTQIGAAEGQLSSGEREYEDGLNSYYSGRRTLQEQISSAESQLASGREQYNSGYSQFLQGRELLTTQLAEGQSKINQGWAELNQGYQQYMSGLEELNRLTADAQNQIDSGRAQIEEGYQQYNYYKAEIDNQINTAQAEIDSGYASYNAALNQFNASVEEYNKEVASTQEQLNEGAEQLREAETTYNQNYQNFLQGKEAYEKAKEEFEAQLPQIEEELNTAKEQLAQIDTGISQVDTELSNLETQLTNATAALEELKTQIASIEENYAKLQSTIEANQKRLSEIEKELEENPDSESLKKEQATLLEQVAALKAQQEELNKTKEELNNKESELNQNLEYINSTKKELTDRKTELTSQRTALADEIERAETEIETNRKTLEEKGEELEQIEISLEEAKNQIESSKQELENAQNEFDAQRAQAESELQSAEAELKNAYATLESSQEELNVKKNEAYSQLETSFAPIISAEEELTRAQAELDSQKQKGEEELNSAYSTLIAAETELENAQNTLRQESERGLEELARSEIQLKTAADVLDENYKLLETQRNLGETKLNDAWITLENARIQIVNGRTQLVREKEAGLRQLQASLVTLQTGERQLDEGKRELQTKEREGREQIDEGWAKINDSKKDVENLSRGDWYVYSRDDNPGYSGYQQDAERIDKVGNVFPLFFFLVAALVAFTTMTRMVEEERTQIGTLYALGYSRWQILKKYVVYAGLAALIGATFGWILGVSVLPYLIFWAYNILYQMPDMVLEIPWHIVIISYIVSFACTIGAAVIVALSELRSVPAELMRPKAPKPGKRIFLERIPALWNRMSFITKVSMRNIFRYKARFFMTVIGIAGCTALILAGFGLHDAIFTIVPSQYGVINHYDQSLIVKDTSTDIDQKVARVVADTRVSGALPVDQETINVITDSGSLSAYLIVPKDTKNFPNFVSLHQRTKRNEPIDLDDTGVVVSEKLATNYGASPGSQIQLEIDNKRYNVEVSNQTENYLENYVYMSPTLYEKLVGKPPEYPLIYVNFTEDLTNTEDQDQFSADMIATGDYTSAINVATAIDTANKTMQSLNILVVVMIVSAGILAFIVLNNLTNINISERVREIATLKVLGFRSKETNNYIFRENIVLSIFGIVLGIFLGILLLRFIIATVELDIIMFGREIHLMSYVYSIVLTLGFTIIVNYTMIPVIKRVDMVEALKDID